jgi:hypothetical protein
MTIHGRRMPYGDDVRSLTAQRERMVKLGLQIDG